MIKYTFLLALLLASCDSAGIEGPPDLPEPDAFGIPIDSVTVRIEVDRAYSGDYYIRFPWASVYQGWPVIDLPQNAFSYVVDTTFHAVTGDSIGFGLDLSIQGSGRSCLSYSITRHGSMEEIAGKETKCTYGLTPKFFVDVVVR